MNKAELQSTTKERPARSGLGEVVAPYISEVLTLQRISRLDVYQEDPDPRTLTENYEWIETRMGVIGQILKSPEDKTVQVTESKIAEVFVNEKTGLVSAFVVLPSHVTDSIRANLVTVSMKTEGDIEDWMVASKEERSQKLIQQIADIEAIVWMNHGLGASEAANACVVDGLARGELVDPVTQKPIEIVDGTMFVSQMSKGAGGTYREGAKEGYKMSTSLAQMVETMCEFDLFMTELQLRELMSETGKDRWEKIVKEATRLEDTTDPIENNVDPRVVYAKEVLRLGELKSGTWFGNRLAILKGHSMGGWEAFREYLANYFGRLPKHFEEYATQLLSIVERKGKITRSLLEQLDAGKDKNEYYHLIKTDFQQVVELMAGFKDIVIDEERGVTLGILANLIFIPKTDHLGNFEIPHGEIEHFMRNLLWNVAVHSESPLVVGPDGVGEDAAWVAVVGVDDKNHAKLVRWRHSPKLKLLLTLQRMGLGSIGFAVGNQLGWVEDDLGRFVDDLAYKCQQLRAIHLWGLGNQRATVLMNAEALEGAQIMIGKETGRAVHARNGYVMVPDADGQMKLEESLLVHVWAGGNDSVLGTEDMRKIIVAGFGLEPELVKQIYIEDEESGHYLTKKLLEKQWRESMGRVRVVVNQRQEVAKNVAMALMAMSTWTEQ